jgi:TP901 family phage tail tape measure protein
MAEPLGVAFVEIEPVAVGFRAKSEALLRSQLAGASASTAASARAAVGHRTEAAALEQKAVAANGAAVAEERAAAATLAHGNASLVAARHVGVEAASMAGLGRIATASTGALAAAAATGFVLFQSAEAADHFAHSLHELENATGATEVELRAAADAAKDLGHDMDLPLTTANDAAEAISLLARSGFDLQDSMTAARGSLLLAAASGQTIENSVREVDRVLDAFNLTAADSERVADAVATGLKYTQGNAEEFAQALATIAPAADSLGLSLEDTNTLVLQLAESGLSTTAAAGSLRQAFLKLAAGGKGVDDGLARIGLKMADLRDELGRLRPDAFVILADALRGVSREQQLLILTQIFSRRAALGVIRIIEQQRVGYELMAEKARQSGTAQEEAGVKAANLSGQFQELKENLQDIALVIGERVLPPILALTEALNKGIGPLADWIGKIQDLTGGSLFDQIGRAVEGAENTVNFFDKIFGGEGTVFITPQVETVALHNQVTKARKDIQDLTNEFAKSKGVFGQTSLTATNEFVVGLQKVRDSIRDTTPEGKKAREEIQKLIRAVQEGKDLPPIQLGLMVDFDAGQTGLTGKQAAQQTRQAWDEVFEAAFPAITLQGERMVDALLAGVDNKKGDVHDAGENTVRQFSLGAQVAIAQAAGDEAAELAALQQQLANAIAHQRRMERLFKTHDVNEQAVINAANRVAAIRGQIASIRASQQADAAAAASDASARAAEIAAAADKRDQDFIKKQQRRLQQRQTAVSTASQTEPLADDIRADIKLRNALRVMIAATRARIRQARAAGRDTEALADQLANLRMSRNQVRREIARLQADAKAQAAETRVENAQLDLQIAEARFGDDPTAAQTNRLIALHQRIIRALKKQQSLVKRRSVEWKRLQLEIEQERAAIRDARNATSASGSEGASFSQQAFSFLTTQQGFFANVSSNVFPGGTAGGAVGGSSTTGGGIGRIPQSALKVSSPFRPKTALAEAELDRKTGMTQAQASVLIHLQRQTLKALQDLHRGAGHPELRKATARGGASMDTQ